MSLNCSKLLESCEKRDCKGGINQPNSIQGAPNFQATTTLPNSGTPTGPSDPRGGFYVARSPRPSLSLALFLDNADLLPRPAHRRESPLATYPLANVSRKEERTNNDEEGPNQEQHRGQRDRLVGNLRGALLELGEKRGQRRTSSPGPEFHILKSSATLCAGWGILGTVVHTPERCPIGGTKFFLRAVFPAKHINN